MGLLVWALVCGLALAGGAGPKHRVTVAPYPIYVERPSVQPLRQVRIGSSRGWARLSSDGRKSLAYRAGGRLELRNNQTQEQEEHWTTSGEFTTAALSIRGDLVAVAEDKGTIRIHDLETNRVWPVLAGRFPARALAFSPDGRYLASADQQYAKLWDLSTGRVSHSFHKVKNVSSLAFSPDGALLALGTLEGKVYVWQTQRRRFLEEFTIGEPVLSVTFTAPGQVAIGTASGWSLWTTSGIRERSVVTDAPIAAIAITRDQACVVTAGQGLVQWWLYRQEE